MKMMKLECILILVSHKDMGSSGALVAAIYDRYAQDKITVLENLTREKLLQLKNIFSQMEAFFTEKFRTRSFK
jgi:hypothetical protein